ncbi:MAG: hypothetical protein WAZ98_00455 [Cyclobacteriaceae bacterium]
MKSKILIILLLALSTHSFSNEAIPPSGSSLHDQYKYLKSDLEIIDGYRMIKMYTMDKFWTVVTDSLTTQKLKLRESAALLAKLQQEIKTLEGSVTTIKNENQELQAGVDSILLFGRTFSKAGVISGFLLVILGLAIVSGILFSIGRVSIHTARELRKLNENLYQEFDTYKRHAVEKEIKLSRELQNHRNKLVELKAI